MTGPRRVIASLFAAILGLCALGVSLPAGAAGPAVAPPTHLRPVQSETDCAKVLTLAAFVCDAAVKAGDLQLIWDESDKRVTGRNVYRVDGGGHTLLGAAPGTARYYLVKKPSGGYAGMCFAVQALVGHQASADSAPYCYAPGATATTLSLKPSHAVTYVNLQWHDIDRTAIFKTADSDFGSASTTFFPWLLKNSKEWPKQPVDGVYAGYEQVVWKRYTPSPNCRGAGAQNADVTAFARVVFPLDPKTLSPAVGRSSSKDVAKTVRRGHAHAVNLAACGADKPPQAGDVLGTARTLCAPARSQIAVHPPPAAW